MNKLQLMVLGGLSFALIACAGVATRYSGPLNDWDVSCGADQGAIQKTSSEWVFKTSANYCTGGTFNQRAEINTENFSTRRAGDFLFSANVTMTAARRDEFSIFSIHDGRNGCAPPLQLFVRPDGRMYIATAVKTGDGESCIDGRIGNISSDRILRNGTEQDLRILVQFDGNGAFDVTVWLDGAQQISGTYSPPNNPSAIVSQRFYFKHGVYSKNVFQYEMRSRDMQVTLWDPAPQE